MKLIIIRHAQTEANAKKLRQGQADIPLNQIGLEQAKKVGERFKDDKFDVLYSSDLSRSKQTAAEILKYHDVPTHYLALIRERSFGDWELTSSNVCDWKNLPGKYVNQKPPGGESWLEMLERAKTFFNMLIEKHHEETVLVVSHGGFIRAFISVILNKPLEEMIRKKQENTCVYIVETNKDKKHTIHTFNCSKHL